MNDSAKVTDRKSSGSTVKLILSGFVFAMVTFVVLPRLAALPRVSERIDWLEAHQIDGGATFYTDHEFLEKILVELEQ